MSEKKEKTFKQHIMDMLARLPDDTPRKKVMYHINVIDNFEAGVESAENEGLVSHEELIAKLKAEATSPEQRKKLDQHLIKYLKIQARTPDIEWLVELSDGEKIGILKGLIDSKNDRVISDEEFWAGWDEPEETTA